MTTYIIEPVGFFDKHNKPFYDDGYLYDNYLPGYKDEVFTDEAKAEAFLADNDKGEDCDGIIAKFRIALCTKNFKLFWIREDKQGSFDMGSFPTKAEAEAAIDAAKAELIDQCGEDYQKAEIEAGSWSIEEEAE
jgi:hypothetical protein